MEVDNYKRRGITPPLTMTEEIIAVQNEQEGIELTLNSTQCAFVALYMYQQWQESQKPPLYTYTPYSEWLQVIIDTDE